MPPRRFASASCRSSAAERRRCALVDNALSCLWQIGSAVTVTMPCMSAARAKVHENSLHFMELRISRTQKV
jgi:hypothetical protein